MLGLGLDFILVISGKQIVCLRRQDRRELLPFDPEPERTLHRLRRKSHATQPNDPHMLLKEFALPPTVVQSTIGRPPIEANNFELKGVTLKMLHNIQFHRLPSENLNTHLTSFIKVCDTVKYNGVIEKALRLRLFPLSLSNRAKHWLTSQPSDSITSWNDLVQKFLTKIFPPAKIAQLVQEINTFRQFEGET